MASIFFNSSSNNHSPYPTDHYHQDHQFLSPDSSSSNSLKPHLFFNSTDQNEFFNQPAQHQHEADKFGSQTYKEHPTETNKSGINNMKNDLNEVKWMSSKMRVMLKMKKSDHVINPNTITTREVKKLEDHKHPTSPTYNSSNSNSSNNSIPIRVCSDCNTTKTPLWRSGPRGPKSLCNACGIRQRKARRAMAASENGNNNVFIDKSIMRPLKVTKTQHKDHKKPHKCQVTKYKKSQSSKQITTITPPLSSSPSPSPSSSPSSSSPRRKNCVEEFLVRLSKNLTLYHVFPQDEKEAAILLMALSCGYAHQT